MNWFAIIVVSIIVIALVVFLIVRNIKDEKDFERQLNQGYHRSKDVEGDVDEEEAVK
jgi:large-conductance mechanosensitive channel